MLRFLLIVPIVLSALVVALSASPVHALDNNAKQAILVDDETGAVLFEKKGAEKMFPASMTKMMTSYIIFKQIAEGKITPETTFPVSETAWRKGGSKMFVRLGTSIAVKDLLPGIIVQSGNDACIVVAEALAGSEDAFAEMMNKEAERLGMKGTHFKNATGWPDPEHVTTPEDLVILSRALVNDFPEFYKLFSQTEFTYGSIVQHNRNLLLGMGLGVDGLKTGHTEAAGYGITVSAKDEATERRIYAVVNGLTSKVERKKSAEILVRFGLNYFANISLEEPLANRLVLPVAYGNVREMAVAPKRKNLVYTVPKVHAADVDVSIRYKTPIKAPVAQGQEVGTLRIKAGSNIQKIPLFATADIAEAGLGERAIQNLGFLFTPSKK